MMENEISFIKSGGITSPKGFRAGATSADIKGNGKGKLDLAILCSEVPCTAAAVFTTNQIKAAPVILSKRRLRRKKAMAVVVNSGNANASTGEQGMADAAMMAKLAAGHVGVAPADVLVASTGVIGHLLPMDRIRAGVERIALSVNGGHDLARAIMTTDTMPKEVAVSAGGFTIGGAAKGSGMIHPNMATLLSFLTTDASVDADFLKQALREAADLSFNMVSVDTDTSTNDTLLIMANGLAGNNTIVAGSAQADVFKQALNQVCIYLAKMIARDGEGATKFIEVNVIGAARMADARVIARTIVGSPLVKTAIYGRDPNWGRVMAAAGRSGVKLVENKIDLDINGFNLVRDGAPLPFDKEDVARSLGAAESTISLSLNLGKASATAWGCDLTEEYVKINSEYTT
jgi:glutamate N-acetyltransferase / amino-acid N-acetyltransferase